MTVADSLYQEQRYFEAGVFCERVLFEQSNDTMVARAILLEVQCFKKQRKFAKAARFIQSVQHRIHSDSLQQQLYYELATSYYLAGDFENTIAIADRTGVLYTGYTYKNWVSMLKILSLNELQRWEEAAAQYRQQASDSLPDYYSHLPQFKSEDKAGWLATFIPGAGQFYAGKPWEALASIALQGVGVYYGVISWQQKHYISAWLIGAGIAGSFHMGGVRRSQELVRLYNKQKAGAFNEKVKQALLQRW
jgi:tetratricopeptide (TPR) repeat protein